MKEQIEADKNRLSSITTDIGFVCITKADDVFVLPRDAALRKGCEESALRQFAIGEEVRDWVVDDSSVCLFPYADDVALRPPCDLNGALRFIWRCRTPLLDRKVFGGETYRDVGKAWYSYGQIPIERFKIKFAITFAEVATHNHFVLDRSGKVFKQTAPVIKLPAGTSEDEYLGLLGLLNSSVACFWLKQVCFPKGGDHVGNEGARVRKTLWDERYAFNATNIAEFPLCKTRPLDHSARLDAQSRQLSDLQPAMALATGPLPTRASLDYARDRSEGLRRQMISAQEELDWRCYHLYGLLPATVATKEVTFSEPIEVALGERAFEIVLARRIAAGQEQTTWFERHSSTPITEIPTHWPEEYRRVVARRIELIESDKSIGLIERPEFKRRWNSPRWDDLEAAALRDWLLARLEAPALWPASAEHPPQLSSTSRLADAISHDADFMQVAALYASHADFDLPQLVADLVTAEAVPALPAQRYTDTGLRKRAQWQDTWTLQRREDAIDAEVAAENADNLRAKFAEAARTTFGTDSSEEARAWIEKKQAEEIKRHQDERKASAVGSIPVPPKYQSKDFLKADFWRLRGGLDVPKERWISYPGCERGSDGSLVIAWAGWDHLQQATALAGYYLDMKDSEGWEPARLQPLLASLLELVPWLEQWHNELDPVFGERMGDYYRGFVTQEARDLGFTLDDLRAWKPAVVAARRGRRKAS